jgi:hypothetical protein
MLNELFVGGSKGLAAKLIEHSYKQGNQIFSITSQETSSKSNLTVDWRTLNVAHLHKYLLSLPKIDLILFNQNSSSLSDDSFNQNFYQTFDLWKQIKTWQQSYFVSCQLPFYIIHTLKDKIHSGTRVIWMLSNMIVNHRDDFQYADYIGNKYQNYLMMKNFSRNLPGCFFGIDPGGISKEEFSQEISGFHQLLNKSDRELSGKVWKFNSELSAVSELLD